MTLDTFSFFFKIRCWQVNSMKTAWWDIKDIGKWNFMAEKGWCWIWYQVITTWIEIKVDPHTCLHMIQMKRNRRRVSVQLKLSAFCCNKNLYKLSKKVLSFKCCKNTRNTWKLISNFFIHISFALLKSVSLLLRFLFAKQKKNTIRKNFLPLESNIKV